MATSERNCSREAWIVEGTIIIYAYQSCSSLPSSLMILFHIEPSLLAILASVTDVISTTEAANRAGVTTQTIRNWVKDGRLTAAQEPWGKSSVRYLVQVASLDELVAVNAQRPSRRRRVDELQDQIDRLRTQIESSGEAANDREPSIALQDAMARLRDVIELNGKATDELAKIGQLTDQVIASHRRIDELRRESIGILEDALIAGTQPASFDQL